MTTPTPSSKPRPKYRKPVGPKLKRLLAVVFALFALLVVNSVYLIAVTVAGVEYQNWFYLNMFLLHLLLGLLIVVPTIVFGAIHIRNSRNRPNKRAIRAGYALFIAAIAIFVTGFVLTRVDAFGLRFEINEGAWRSVAYWMHVLVPVLAIWLFVLHRLAGKRIKWGVGLTWGAVAAGFALVMLVLQTQDPRAWNVTGPSSGDAYFQPSLARTSTGQFIPEMVLDNDEYCLECHADIHDQWSHSVHKFSSFNNPPYLFSVKETRAKLMARDGDVHAARFCAGCHDPVPFFSGAFDDPKFDDPHYDLASDRTAQAGITCTVCHSISHVNSPRGNADYTIDEPVHYPFAFSDSTFLRWVNRQLVKAKPAFHKATFLKPLHRSTEYCGTCHKVHLPEALNKYKWLRGQNHQDAFLLSGVSGHGITSFYYPPKAQANCNGCHMPLVATGPETNFSSRVRDDSGVAKTLNHMFPSANTAMPRLRADAMDDPEAAIAAHQAFLEGVMRVDLFGVRDGGTITGELTAPLRPAVPALAPGSTHLVEAVIRTMKMGHVFTQGTADSNQVWMELTVTDADGDVVGGSGAMNEAGEVDPWAHFVNAFVLDREGRRIDRRNAEDIFIALYNHQIPPGAADVVHYLLRVPPDAEGTLTVTVRLLYRKFDTNYMRLVHDDPDWSNDLPITVLAEDAVTFPIDPSADAGDVDVAPPADRPEWVRWNDYGIALIRKGQFGELRQAKAAFERVEQLGRPDGPLNLARVYIKEGLVQSDAPEALARAAAMDPAAPPWSLLWFGAVVAESNGDYDRSIDNLRRIIEGGFVEAIGRDFDFSKDWRVLNRLAGALYQRGLIEGGDAGRAMIEEARTWYERTLELDPEDLAAHWGLTQVCGELGDGAAVAHHAAEHQKYKPDDNARDTAIAAARARYPAADHAAEAVVIYDLHRVETDEPVAAENPGR